MGNKQSENLCIWCPGLSYIISIAHNIATATFLARESSKRLEHLGSVRLILNMADSLVADLGGVGLVASAPIPPTIPPFLDPLTQEELQEWIHP